MDIDFVVLWVDGNDPAWQAEKAKYQGGTTDDSNTPNRFRDWGLMPYWFRAVEKFTPWVRKIHFVTCGHVPEFLNLAHPKLHHVKHADFLPAQVLPTFSSHAIELNLHRIPGLAEHFVYFNDDFYIINKIGTERFFKGGLPCDIAAFLYNPSWSQWYRRIKNNLRIINRHFDKKEVMARYHDKWFDKSYGSKARWNYILKPYGKFITLRTPHNAQPYLKTTFEEVWAAAGKELTATSVNRFRALDDYTPELFRTWQICRGNFEPYNTYSDTKMFPLMIRPKQAVRAIYEQSYSLVCLNDNVHIRHYGQVMENIRNAFEHILPEKSSFEC